MSPEDLASRLYVGSVMHERRSPRINRFEYGVYSLLVDLDELPELDRRLKRFSYNRWNLVSLHDSDHGARDGTPMRTWIDAQLASAGIDPTGGRVLLLTFPRVLGFRFYPVSFWYCLGADGEPRAVLAEVHNTFGGRHNYLLHECGRPLSWKEKRHARKVFRVSPFIPTSGRYEFRFSEPGETLSVGIYDYIDEPLLLVASLRLREQPLTDEALVRTVRRYGPISVRAWLLIHYQALRLVAKGIRYLSDADHVSEEEEARPCP